MGSLGSNFKNALDPINLVHNKDQPRTISNGLHNVSSALDPVFTTIKDATVKHNNTQDNTRAQLDPGQLFGANATVAPGPNPNAPGSIMNMGGVGGNGMARPFNPNLGIPVNGVSTNGLQQPQMMPQPQGYFNPQGGTPNFGMQNGPVNNAQQGPNWSSIIANALQGPTKQAAGMPVGPRFNK